MYLTIQLENGKKITKTWAETDFSKGFLANLYLRPCCGDCQFCGRIRPGDITIGDLWAPEAAEDRKKGISQVLINSKKGERFFKSLEKDWAKKYPVDLDKTKDSAQYINGFSSEHHPGRTRFFDLIKSISVKEAVDRCFYFKYDIAQICMRNHNYGNQLTDYALYSVLTDMGKQVLVVDRPQSAYEKPFTNPEKIWINQPYPDYALAKNYQNKEEMSELNGRVDIFLVASDQTLTTAAILALDKYTLLDWVHDFKPKTSYASSFAFEYFVGDNKTRAEIGFFLNKFDAVSVRETSGTKYAKDSFGIDVEQVLDPVFLCDSKIYDDLAKNGISRIPKEKFLGGYILGPSNERSKFIESLCEKLNLKETCMIIDVRKADSEIESSWTTPHLSEAKIEELLACVKNSQFFITDSFHGVCFALIYQKQFLVLFSETQRHRGTARIPDLLESLNLEDRVININDVSGYQKVCDKPIDYDAVYTILNKDIFRSRTWLTNTLSNIIKKPKIMTEYDILNERINEKLNAYVSIFNSKIDAIKIDMTKKSLFAKTKISLKQHGLYSTIKLIIKKIFF